MSVGCWCTPATYWQPAELCSACEERMEDEERQERFEREYEGVDPATGYPLSECLAIVNSEGSR